MAYFQNTYLMMRHGQSEANANGVIVSDPKIGRQGFGLTERGREQALVSTQLHLDAGIDAVICSDFLRTRQTAEIATEQLQLAPPVINRGLRERFFGCWDGQSDRYYQQVWAQDVSEDRPPEEGVETTAAVLQRGLLVLQQLEQAYQNRVLLLVSHGDMLQILRTAFVGIPSGLHRSLEHHETAEIRPLAQRGQPYPELLSRLVAELASQHLLQFD